MPHQGLLRGGVTHRSVTTLSAGVNGRGPGAHPAMPCAGGELQLPNSSACWAKAAPCSSVLGAQAPLNVGVKQLLVNAGAQQHSAGGAQPRPCVWVGLWVGGVRRCGNPPSVRAVLAGADVFHFTSVSFNKKNELHLSAARSVSLSPLVLGTTAVHTEPHTGAPTPRFLL